jgi:hypothetical protein
VSGGAMKSPLHRTGYRSSSYELLSSAEGCKKGWRVV